MDIQSLLTLFSGTIFFYGFLFVFVLTLVVFIHELGHYLVARYFGIHIESFSIGMGREIIGRTDHQGCRWSLRLVPFGGYIRMFFPNHTEELSRLPEHERQRAFCAHPAYQRVLVAIAGPAFNFLFAVLVLVILYMGLGRPSPQPYISALEANSPAHLAGMKIGDLILSVDGTDTAGSEDVKAAVAHKIGQEVLVDIEREGKRLSFTLKPKELKETNDYGFVTRRGILGAIWPNYGFMINEIFEVDGHETKGNLDTTREWLKKNMGREVFIIFGNNPPQKLLVSIKPELNQALYDRASKDYNTLTVGPRPIERMQRANLRAAINESLIIINKNINLTYGTLFQIIAGQKKTDELGGVIKISRMTAKLADQGVFIFISFIALLSVSVGVINLLPIPGLDGGNLLFYVAEGIKKSPVSIKTLAYVYGFSFIFLLMVVVTINLRDISNLVLTALK